MRNKEDILAQKRELQMNGEELMSVAVLLDECKANMGIVWNSPDYYLIEDILTRTRSQIDRIREEMERISEDISKISESMAESELTEE